MDQDKVTVDQSWLPSANKKTLQQRASLMAAIRDFFDRRNVLEVDTPVLATTSVTDINIDSISARVNSAQCFLQTSPEYFMKRLLAAGMGDIFSLGKVFRDAEVGPRHNPEFTLLEWYRLDWDEHQLMSEVGELVNSLYASQDQQPPEVTYLSYADCFSAVFSLDPHSCHLTQLQSLAIEIGSESWAQETRANCLDLLFSQRIERQLPDGLVFVYDYPACQAALAETHYTDKGQQISCRFEAFLNGMELANGYFELTDAQELKRRFEADNEARSVANKNIMPLDSHFHSAMVAGLPRCSGVALGVDRLLMALCGHDSIECGLPFSWQRC